jgi:hypothetical protein
LAGAGVTDLTWLNGKLIAVDGVEFPDMLRTNRPARILPHGIICYGEIGNLTDYLESAHQPRIAIHSSAPVAFWAEAVCRAALIVPRAN